MSWWQFLVASIGEVDPEDSPRSARQPSGLPAGKSYCPAVRDPGQQCPGVPLVCGPGGPARACGHNGQLVASRHVGQPVDGSGKRGRRGQAPSGASIFRACYVQLGDGAGDHVAAAEYSVEAVAEIDADHTRRRCAVRLDRHLIGGGPGVASVAGGEDASLGCGAGADPCALSGQGLDACTAGREPCLARLSLGRLIADVFPGVAVWELEEGEAIVERVAEQQCPCGGPEVEAVVEASGIGGLVLQHPGVPCVLRHVDAVVRAAARGDQIGDPFTHPLHIPELERPCAGYVSRYPSGPAVRGPREHPTRCASPYHPIVDRTYREEPESSAGFLRGDGRRATRLPEYSGKVGDWSNAIGAREDCRGGQGGSQDRKSARTRHGDLQEVTERGYPPHWRPARTANGPPNGLRLSCGTPKKELHNIRAPPASSAR